MAKKKKYEEKENPKNESLGYWQEEIEDLNMVVDVMVTGQRATFIIQDISNPEVKEEERDTVVSTFTRKQCDFISKVFGEAARRMF